MEKQLFIIYFLVVSGALSCCIPKQWEGHQSVIVGQIMGDKGELIEASLNVSYAITINKVAMFGETRKDGNLIKTQILQDFTAGKQYVVEHDKCTVSNTVGQMSNCIPANSTTPTSSYYGFLSHKLDVDTYQYKASAGEVVQVTVTKVNHKDNVPCALIGTFVKTDGPPSANNSLRIIGTSGITQMIRNQTVFDIPTACLHGAVVKEVPDRRSPIPCFWIDVFLYACIF